MRTESNSGGSLYLLEWTEAWDGDGDGGGRGDAPPRPPPLPAALTWSSCSSVAATSVGLVPAEEDWPAGAS